jgi:hypothetical protein
MAMLSSRVLMSFTSLVMKSCIMVWSFTGCNKFWYMRSIEIVVAASTIAFLWFVLWCTLSTSYFVTVFFPNSSSLGNQLLLINLCAALCIIEYIAIDLVTSLYAFCPMCWQWSRAYKSIFLSSFDGWYNSGSASKFSVIHLSMSAMLSRIMLYCLSFFYIWLFFLMIVVVASWKRCGWDYMSMMASSNSLLTFSTLTLKLWRILSSILTCWSLSSSFLILASFSSFC